MALSCGCIRTGQNHFREQRLPRTIPSEVQKMVSSRTNLAAAEINSLYSHFRQSAPNGEMSFSKFRNTMGMLGMLDDLFLPFRMFCAFDTNEDNKLDFVEFAIALGTMIRGEDEAKLELAFEILSPLKSTRKRERLGQELTATDGDCYSDRNMGSLKCSKFTGRGSISSPSGRPLSPYPSPVTAKQNSKNGTSEQDESTRRQLIGGSGNHFEEWYVEQVFRQVGTIRPDGTPFMTLNDFKKAVRTNIDFLFVLGIYPSPQDRRHLSNTALNIGKKLGTEKINSHSFSPMPAAQILVSMPEYPSELLPQPPAPTLAEYQHQSQSLDLTFTECSKGQHKRPIASLSIPPLDAKQRRLSRVSSYEEEGNTPPPGGGGEGTTQSVGIMGDSARYTPVEVPISESSTDSFLPPCSRNVSSTLQTVQETPPPTSSTSISKAALKSTSRLIHLRSELLRLLEDLGSLRSIPSPSYPALDGTTVKSKGSEDASLDDEKSSSSLVTRDDDRQCRFSSTMRSRESSLLRNNLGSYDSAVSRSDSPEVPIIQSETDSRPLGVSRNQYEFAANAFDISPAFPSRDPPVLDHSPTITSRKSGFNSSQNNSDMIVLSRTRKTESGAAPQSKESRKLVPTNNTSEIKRPIGSIHGLGEIWDKKTGQRDGGEKDTETSVGRGTTADTHESQSDSSTFTEAPISHPYQGSQFANGESTTLSIDLGSTPLPSMNSQVILRKPSRDASRQDSCQEPKAQSSMELDLTNQEILSRLNVQNFIHPEQPSCKTFPELKPQGFVEAGKMINRARTSIGKNGDGNSLSGEIENVPETTPAHHNLSEIEIRLKGIVEWINNALANSSDLCQNDTSEHFRMLHRHTADNFPSFCSQGGECGYLGGLVVKDATGALSKAATTASIYPHIRGVQPDLAGLLAPITSSGEPPPRMFMNKPNFEQRRSKRQGSIAQIQQRIQRRRPEYKLLGPQKGFAVHFGHPSWNMVLNMMVGIRLAAGRINNEPRRRVEAYDFIMKEKISILPRSASVVETHSTRQNMEAVRFIDYAPMVFRKIREFFGINSNDYLQSVGPEQLVGNMVLGNLASLSELCSEGKSGAFFYYTADGRFLIKTVTRDAAKFLRHILRDYYEHILKNPDTLITRFYGYHAIRVKKESGNVGAKLYFVIMRNFFHTPVEIHRRYDLKGSWVGRLSGPAARSDPTIALKDLDLVELKDNISVGSERKDALISAIKRDADFFQKHLILDYSLLVGIHFRQDIEGEKTAGETHYRELLSPRVTSVSNTDQPSLLTREDSTAAFARKPFHQRDMGGMISSDGKKLYYLGIIDILTKWTTSKRLEHDFKAMKIGGGGGVSCIHPVTYASRFVEFLTKHIE